MIQQLLFCFTFIFGVLALLTKTKLFNQEITGFFDTIYWNKTHIFFKWLDIIILLISLTYQINYWLYK